MKRRIPKAKPPTSEAESENKVRNDVAPPGPTVEPVSADQAFIEVPLKPDDIGAELLPILSRGLYSDPFHALREYVQNAVDAKAPLVRIKLTGNSLFVRDEGKGMSYADLIHARRFGVSHKTPDEHVGFRGIGIYSGYDLCDRLLITSQQERDKEQNVLEFNFGAMKRKLAASKTEGAPLIPLHELIQQHTRFRKEPSTSSAPGTTVMLEEISPFHINRLRDTDELKKYILRNLPVDMEADFEHRTAIKNFLRDNVPGYKAVRIQVDIDGKVLSVARPSIPNLAAPELRVLRPDGSEKPVAVIWSCLYQGSDGERGKIPDSFSDYRGFVYKVKGFTVGDNRLLHHSFKSGSGTLYSWYTGEVYVIDDAVIPNTERNYFESNPAYEVLRAELKSAMGVLESAALKFQSKQRADQNLRDAAQQLADIETQITHGIGDRVDHITALDDLIKKLKKQRNKVSSEQKDNLRSAEKRASDLRTQVRKLIDKAGKSSKSTNAATGTAKASKTSSTKAPSLVRLIQGLEIELSPEHLTILGLIDEALEAVLQKGSTEHQAVLNEFKAYLEREFSDE